MPTICPLYPSMFMGSFTYYYATTMTGAPPVCGAPYTGFSGPNGLSCGCNGSGCTAGPSFFKNLGLQVTLVEHGGIDVGTLAELVNPSQKPSSVHGDLRRYGLPITPQGRLFAPGVQLADEKIVEFNPGSGSNFVAKLLRLSFKTSDFDIAQTLPLETPGTADIAALGWVTDAAPTGTPNSNVTLVTPISRYQFQVTYREGDGALWVYDVLRSRL